MQHGSGDNSPMTIHWSALSPLDYFAVLVQQDAELPLLEAAATLAQDEYPELDVQQVLTEVDQLQARVQRRLPKDAGSLQRLRMLNQFLYRDLGFAGNLNHYTDPENSYLHAVLRTRRAIPISMAVLWLELAQGMGLKARGISFPGHFLVKVQLTEGQVIMDPLNGQSLSREHLLERLEAMDPNGSPQALADWTLGMFLQSATPREILARMLRNLNAINTVQEVWPRLIPVLDRMLVLLPQAWDERRDRGLALAEMGEPQRAVADLEAYLAHVPEAEDRLAVQNRVAELRRTTL